MSLAHLNVPQREAILYLDGPLLVLAGAGSGKTRVITQKIAYLINEAGFDPRHIAAITFTNKAAREMDERVGHLMQGKSSKGLTVSTFHSLGLNLLRREAKHIGYKPQFSILDSADATKIISDMLSTTDKQEIRRVQGLISRWKNAGADPGLAEASAADEGEAHAARLYRGYQDTLTAYQALDFDDLIRLPLMLLETNAEVLERWQSKLRYLLIDEYQDTNTCQYRFIKLLAGVRGMFTAVGDDDQSIYAWRGADIENIRGLQDDYPRLKVVKLEQNYRSTVRILQAANQVIGNNPKVFDKKLWSELGHGAPVTVIGTKDDDHEAETVCMRLLAHKFEHRGKYGDYAILYRGNHQARLLEQHLRNQRIPYLISGGQSFFEKAEIKDVIAYLRLIANNDDDPAFIRAITTPKRGIGAATLEKLGLYAASRQISLFAAVFELGLEEQLRHNAIEDLQAFCTMINTLVYRAEREPAGDVLSDLLKTIGYENWLYDQESPKTAETRWKNVLDMVGWLSRKGEDDGKNLLELTQMIALITLLEGRDEEEPDAVRLSTLHASKGLEYPHVYLVGCEEDILPHRESIVNGQIEEERRLMYVGITRAQHTLTISYAMKRKRAGEWHACEASRFITELPQDDIKWIGKPGGNKTAPVSKQEGNDRLANMRAMLQSGKR